MKQLSRLQPGPLFLRALTFIAAAGGLWFAAPLTEPKFLAPIVVLALLPAIGPGSRAVGAVMVLTIGSWLVSTLGFAEEVSPTRTFAVACALYLTHSSAAMAALLPHDSIVDSQVLARWAARTALVVAASAAVTAGVVALAPRLTPTTSVWMVLLGLAAAAATVSLLAWSAGVRRKV